ncbi:MAG TPA: hypothetical protein VHH15_03145, partial [Actinophytocola sp.]|nr:hypothetical protein [Actinophytocola sp.]
MTEPRDHTGAPLDHRIRRGWTPGGGQDAILSDHAARWLYSKTGLTEVSTPAAPDSALVAGEPALPDTARAALADVVGPEHVLLGRDDRLGR